MSVPVGESKREQVRKSREDENRTRTSMRASALEVAFSSRPRAVVVITRPIESYKVEP
jgi:hypothetical protein